METIVCYKCEKKYGLKDMCTNANLHVLGRQGDESNCGLCGEQNGGACVDVPLEIVERARTATNNIILEAVCYEYVLVKDGHIGIRGHGGSIVWMEVYAAQNLISEIKDAIIVVLSQNKPQPAQQPITHDTGEPTETCPTCKGKGRYSAQRPWYTIVTCQECGGSGKLPVS